MGIATNNTRRVLIGIQARCTSERLPRKVLLKLGERPIIEHVFRACQESADYINGDYRANLKVDLALLVPFGDDLIDLYKDRYQIIEGDEQDVLSRYVTAQAAYNSDYIVRITSDCPLISPFIISKHIRTAAHHGLDYVSNVDPEVRTTLDGHDCEVMSKDMLTYINNIAQSKEDREHVTTAIRREQIPWARIGHIIGWLDFSGIKLSVDTKEDYRRMCDQYETLQKKIKRAYSYNPKRVVVRL